METLQNIHRKIFAEITSDDAEIRSEYLSYFKNEFEEFVEAMSHSFLLWVSSGDLE